MQLIVLGMHRSGTSAVTRLLNMAGAYFGPEGIATDANEENPKGFWERRDVRGVCDGLLQDAGFDWWKVNGFTPNAVAADIRERHMSSFAAIVAGMDAHRPWVMKEPRLCLLLPVLAPVLEMPVCVHVTREPLETSMSVASRNGFPLPAALALWEHYTLHSIRASSGLPRHQIRYEDLLSDPVNTLSGLISWLEEVGVRGLRLPSATEIEAFIDPSLHRQRERRSDRQHLLNGAQTELAVAIDGGRIFDDEWMTRSPSRGANETLRAFENERRLETVLDETTANLARAQAEAQKRFTDLERESDERLSRAQAEVAEVHQRFDEIDRTITDGLRHVDDRLGAIERSSLFRATKQLLLLRQRLTPGVAIQDRGPIERVRGHVSEMRRVLESSSDIWRATTASGPEEVVEQVPGGLTIKRSGPARVTRTGRPKVAVLAWDVGHNPLGRAYIMAELLSRRFAVEVWGAQFERYGHQLWAPLRRPEIPVLSFTGRALPGHLDSVDAVAAAIDADLLWVSKPRLPSIALGVVAKQRRNRPLVVDVDDHELSFFDVDRGIDLDAVLSFDQAELALPFERAWTQACEPMIGHGDALTVSNVALAERYGGVLVPHARDEQRFDPARVDREATRARLGVGPTDRLLLFGGTPRAHKGVIGVLEALERLGDRRYRLALFGTRELAQLSDRIGDLDRWVLPLPYQHFGDLPAIVGAADLSCVLQDVSNPVARHQMPAKVTDALAMEVPCIVTDVPPLRPLVDADVVHVHDRDRDLADVISSVFDDPQTTRDRAKAGRELFLAAYSYEAVSERVAPLFHELLEDPPPLSGELERLVDTARRVGSSSGAEAGTGRSVESKASARSPGTRRWEAGPGELYDLVVFWKQNDSSLYGRRQDMFLEHLRRSGRFGTIVHFDNPVSPEQLAEWYRDAAHLADQRRLVVRQTVERLLHRQDRDGVIRRTFVFAGRRSRLLRLPPRSAYADYVRSVLERHGVGEKRLTVFWVYPTNEDLPRVIDQLDPDLVVADVVDDNRTWYSKSELLHARVERNYREVLGRSDLILANCWPVAEAMREFAPGVHHLPNGCDLSPLATHGVPPRELQELEGPVIGYVGNLSDRIDIDLLDGLARRRRDWNFVFVGSAHLDRSIMRLDRHDNVRFLGVRRYEEARRLVAAFDVALIPHLDNEMTRSMNPLKAFVYGAAGVPVVSTPIANTDELDRLITVASGVGGFVEAIEAALKSGRRSPDLDALQPHAWERRIEQVIGLIDRAAGVPGDRE
jgi:glycosyltransferase involved in cell wall biosynthesis